MRTALLLATVFLGLSFQARSQQRTALEPDAKRTAAALDAIMASEKATHNARYRAEIKVTDEKGQEETQSEVFETMERFRLTTSKVDVISLPNGVWVRNAGETQWSELDTDQASKVKRLPALSVEAIGNSTNFTDLGATTWQGQPTHAYSFETDATIEGARVVAHTKVYVNSVGLILGSESDNAKNGKTAYKVQKNTFDPTIHIQAPRATE